MARFLKNVFILYNTSLQSDYHNRAKKSILCRKKEIMKDGETRLAKISKSHNARDWEINNKYTKWTKNGNNK